MTKSIHDLVLEDFQTCPVWKPVDDFEDPAMEVVPYHGEFFDLEEMYLIACKFRLADESEWQGYVRFSWGNPIVMALAINNREFILIASERLAASDKSHRDFAKRLNRKEDDVFPIEYQSKVKFYLQSKVY